MEYSFTRAADWEPLNTTHAMMESVFKTYLPIEIPHDHRCSEFREN